MPVWVTSNFLHKKKAFLLPSIKLSTSVFNEKKWNENLIDTTRISDNIARVEKKITSFIWLIIIKFQNMNFRKRSNTKENKHRTKITRPQFEQFAPNINMYADIVLTERFVNFHFRGCNLNCFQFITQLRWFTWCCCWTIQNGSNRCIYYRSQSINIANPFFI